MNEQNIQNLSSYAGNQQAIPGAQQSVNNDAESVKQMAVNDLKTIKALTYYKGYRHSDLSQQLYQYVYLRATRNYYFSIM